MRYVQPKNNTKWTRYTCAKLPLAKLARSNWSLKLTFGNDMTGKRNAQRHSTHFKFPVCQCLTPRVPAKMLICCPARSLACLVLRIFIKLNNIMCSHICNKIHFMSFLIQYNIHLIFSKWISLLLFPFIFFCHFFYSLFQSQEEKSLCQFVVHLLAMNKYAWISWVSTELRFCSQNLISETEKKSTTFPHIYNVKYKHSWWCTHLNARIHFKHNMTKNKI